jgi:K+-transporting ATPase ATPase B chain
MLVTRGALTTFSIANDVAKYFAIIPAAFAATDPAHHSLKHHAAGDPGECDLLGRDLQRPSSISCLVPLALRGVKTRADSQRRASCAEPA